MVWTTRLSDRYFFWTGNSTLHTAIGTWQRSLQRLFKLAGIENGYAHRFRDTFSVELLLAGVPIEQVSVLIGHSGSKIRRCTTVHGSVHGKSNWRKTCNVLGIRTHLYSWRKRPLDSCQASESTELDDRWCDGSDPEPDSFAEKGT